MLVGPNQAVQSRHSSDLIYSTSVQHTKIHKAYVESTSCCFLRFQPDSSTIAMTRKWSLCAKHHSPTAGWTFIKHALQVRPLGHYAYLILLCCASFQALASVAVLRACWLVCLMLKHAKAASGRTVSPSAQESQR
jgi:hypothetical protein